MEVIRAKSAGFCFGVKRAVDTVYEPVSYTHLLVGRTDLLKVRDVPTSKRAATLDLSRILNNPYAKEKKGMIFNPKKVFDFELNKTLDERVLVKELLPSLEKKQKRILELDVCLLYTSRCV